MITEAPTGPLVGPAALPRIVHVPESSIDVLQLTQPTLLETAIFHQSSLTSGISPRLRAAITPFAARRQATGRICPVCATFLNTLSSLARSSLSDIVVLRTQV